GATHGLCEECYLAERVAPQRGAIPTRWRSAPTLLRASASLPPEVPMRFQASSSLLSFLLVTGAAALGTACSDASVGDPTSASDQALSGPGNDATDARKPELGDDLSILNHSRISLADGVARVTTEYGPVIEAKFELGDDGRLSLSLYPVARGLSTDPER